jgi:hypothetical protein
VLLAGERQVTGDGVDEVPQFTQAAKGERNKKHVRRGQKVVEVRLKMSDVSLFHGPATAQGELPAVAHLPTQ